MVANGTARLRWWVAGGLHAHVTYPDGSWLRQVWKLVGGSEPWWEIDALRSDLEKRGYSVDVMP